MVGIIIAMHDEIRLEDLKILKTEFYLTYELYYLKEDVVLVFSKIGKANAAAAIQLLLAKYQHELKTVLNFGTVGSNNSAYQPLDTFFINQFQYLDVDVTAFHYHLNQIPHQDKVYEFNHNDFIDAYLNKLNKQITYTNKRCGTADSFINKENITKFKEVNDVDVFDMEAMAIAQICDHYHLDFYSFKIISDLVEHKLPSNAQFKEHLDKIATTITNWLKLI